MRKLIFVLLLASSLVSCKDTPIGKCQIVEKYPYMEIFRYKVRTPSGDTIEVSPVPDALYYNTVVGDTVPIVREPWMGLYQVDVK